MIRGPVRSPGVLAAWIVLAAAGAVPVSSCTREAAPAAAAPGPGVSAAVAATPLVRVVALGDSLTAGYGLEAGQAYPALLEVRLRAAGLHAEVVNAGVSGDTSAGGLRRLDWSLDGDPQVLIVALGGNDALRGLPVDDLKRNLATIIERAQARRIAVILAGMEAPPNLGPVYTLGFRRVYRDLADQYDVPLLPFLLAGVAGNAGLNQRDGIHPNADGVVKVVDNLWPLVERAVRAAVTP